MAKGQQIPQSEIDAFIASAKKKVDAAAPGNHLIPETVARRIQTESGGASKSGIWTDPGATGKDGKGATGIAQMFPPAVAEAHKLLYGETLTGDALQAKYKEITDSPEKSILYAYALYAALEKQVRGYLKSQNIDLNDDNAIRTICSAAYHLGMGNFKGNATTPAYSGVQALITQANTPPPFSLTKFVEGYERTTNSIGQPSGAIRKEAGIGGTPVTGSSQQPVRGVDFGEIDAAASTYSPLAFDVSGATPATPTKVLPEGLDNLAWSDKKGPGGLVGNPHLRQLSAPAWFELRLNKTNGESLSDSAGNPLQFKLNVSLQSVNTKSQHIVNRTETATGLMITFWGSQPDSIVGRGTTGLFLNTMGLTSYMSSKGSLESNGLLDHLEEVLADNPRMMAKILGSQENLRVAAQDAFLEFTALFKNNGVVRFLPAWRVPPDVQVNGGQFTRGSQSKLWSPTSGATGFQMLNRAGDTYTRGHVAFKYKGQTYLGYFKSMNFTADANSPFKWDFDFNFRVLRSLSPVFKFQGGRA